MRQFIELFAGCGGMSLGLQSKNFDLVLANELSPMAAETFALNHLGIDLSKTTSAGSNKVSWLASNHSIDNLDKRLRENPYETRTADAGGYSDINDEDLVHGRHLIIGSIVQLNEFLEQELNANIPLKDKLTVDLVSGGPPCQSFSMAGLRQKDNHRNRLPWEFARFVGLTRPKIALLENVSGILRAFKEGGNEFHAWIEVSKAFASIGYAPICIHVNAKYVGLPQNRPRFIMLALRRDVLDKLLRTPLNDAEKEALELALESLSSSFRWDQMKYWDVSNSADAGFFLGDLFGSFFTHRTSTEWVPSQSALQDLEISSKSESPQSSYVQKINILFGHKLSSTKTNTQLRKHTNKVKQRFRVYQVLENVGIRSLFSAICNENDPQVLKILTAPLLKEEFLFEGNSLRTPRDMNEVVDLFKKLKTKKHTQRALVRSAPAPAALSIPDDCCHYSETELRTLSVREVARLQSFPDSFEFKSKVTTGGMNRKFEVPQYTQAGNAVPPLLARAAGTSINTILERIETIETESLKRRW
ncbi:DNA cytosine methyltransferase [Glutamicibacter mishrai]|uniref:DNA cytosine methyltransferase n=1 Tax=Glutamicibacter mishrai TaxID=1775880 RepID=UPI001C20363D|nr:DNA cytosine methyltransferase [Glutamicibacter mishrai]